MNVVICLIIGIVIGAAGGIVHANERQKEKNRARWRRYAAAKKAKRGR